MSEREGVIKYQLVFHRADPLKTHDYADLDRWHQRFKAAGLLGQEPARYEGCGFGNISQRLPGGGFIISGTQTGGLDALGPADYARVISSDIEHNSIEAEGRVKPSSEALSHAAVYALAAEIRFVFHVHSPDIWQARDKLDLPSTRAEVPYGTPQMAQEIGRLYEAGLLQTTKVLTMAGHEDGVIGFGQTADEAGGGILRVLKSVMS